MIHTRLQNPLPLELSPRSVLLVLLLPIALIGSAASATPPLDITGLTFVSSQGEQTELVVRAETARFRPDADVADLNRVNATVSAGPGRAGFEIRCDEGSLNLKSNSFWARGNVHGRTESGREFVSEWVRYDHAEGLLFTDAPVQITDSGTTLEGGGFRYYVREQRFRLLGGATLVQQP
jgi:LPS export ABC transporter protein LptC